METDLEFAKVGDVGDVSKDAIVAMRPLLTAVGHEMAVPKKGFVELLGNFATEVHSVHRESQAASHLLNVQKAIVVELELIVRLLTGTIEKAAGKQKDLSAKKAELASTKSVLDAKEVALKAKVLESGQLNYDSDAARAVVA